MIKNTAIRSNASTIRQMAVLRHEEKQTLPVKSLSEEEVLEHAYELEVHQIELELQIEAIIQERDIFQDLSKKYKHAAANAKAACDKYTDLYNLQPSGYFSLTKDGEIIESNLCGSQMLGKDPLFLKSRRFGIFVSDATKPNFNHFLAKAFKSNTKETCRLSLSAGNNLPGYVYLTGIVNQNSEQCFVSMVDISELRQEEQAWIKAKESSEEKDRLKSAFLANMGHEIKTPMHGIMGFTELLKKPGLSVEKQLMCISMIEKGGTHMLNIINDLTDIAKIESGHLNVHISAFNINEQIKFIYDFFKPEVEHKGMQLLFEYGLPTEVSIIHSDRDKILAVLTNLVKNAIKYSDKGTIEIGYNLKPAGNPFELVSKQAELEFYVKDTGIGIPQDKTDVVFHRFVQAHIGHKRTAQGAGLGLAISKAYVEKLGGEIWVHSDEGKGSTFYFTIPSNRKPKVKTVIENGFSE